MSNEQLEVGETLYRYLRSVSDREHPVLAQLREETANHPLAMMQVTPMAGQFLQVLVMATKARRIIEVGTFTGYSSTAMALALGEDGEVVTCDISEEWTAIARRYWQKAGIAHKVKLKLAPALQTLDALIAQGETNTFDMAFLDGDKPEYWQDWERALTLLRPGGLMVVDNTLFYGGVVPGADPDIYFVDYPKDVRPRMAANAKAISEFNEKVKKDMRVHLAMLPVADGMTLAVKKTAS